MKKIVASISKVSLATVMIFSLFGSIASAHVSVVPNTSSPGAWETYTVKVPVEKEAATTKFTLKIPSGAEFESYQPVPGWKFTSQKDTNGKVTSITFETAGEGILPGQFQQFVFVVKNQENAGNAVWDAFQYYKDGSIVEWTGDKSSKTPHSITNIVTAAAGNQTQAMKMEPAKEKAKIESASKNNNSLPTILSIVAVLLSLVSVGLAFRKK